MPLSWRASHAWLFVLASLLAGTIRLASAEAVIVGTWQGYVVQPGAEPYSTTMRVSLPSSRGTCGTVDYPELGCGGELHDCNDQGDGSYRMLERINRGQQRCVDGGIIEVRPSAGSLSWAWFYPDGRAGASATLSRTEALANTEAKQRLCEFVRRNGIESWPQESALYRNPFQFEDQTISIRAQFVKMYDRTSAIFIPQTLDKIDDILVYFGG